MKKLGYAPQALRDIASIGRYIAKDNPARARSFGAELRAKAAQIAARPFSFRPREDLRPGLRSAFHGAYLLLFRVLEDEVRIVRVVHGAQNLGNLLID